MKRSRSFPIFYDRTLRREWVSRRLFSVGFLLFLSIFSVTVLSILAMPALPHLSLPGPDALFRAATAPTETSTPILPAHVVPELPRQSAYIPAGKTLAFFVDWDENSTTALHQQIQSIDILSPEWLHMVRASGGVVEDDPAMERATLAFIQSARPSLPIVPLVNNYSPEKQIWDSEALGAMLADTNARSATIAEILNFVKTHELAGIMIDFESIPDASQGNLAIFMQELFAVFHPAGLEVMQSIPLDDDSFDAALLSKSSDALVLMAYDEHAPFDTLPGPIASNDWFLSSLAARFREVSPEKVIVALGGYGYDWNGNGFEGNDSTFHQAMQTAHDAHATVSLDRLSGNPTFSYADETGSIHIVWYLDAVTAFNQVSLARRFGAVAGFALWRLGSEDPGVWQVLRHQTELDAKTAGILQNMTDQYDILYQGNGEILRVSGEPKTGRRILTLRESTGLLTQESVVEFPLSYTVARWGSVSEKRVALTFDDGPDPKYTPQILDILNRFHVPATFFVIGVNANTNTNLLLREFSDGHEIGSHTFTHPNISLVSAERMRLELDATERLIESVLGRKTLLFRPPYSEDLEPSNPSEVGPLALTDSLGYYTVGMRIDPRDWSRPGTEKIVNEVVSGVLRGDGHIILLHDSGGNRDETVAALPRILETLQQQGYSFVTVSDLLGLSRDDVMPVAPPRELFVARINRVAFFGIAFFFSFVRIASFVGIAFGSFRLLFVGLLALAQSILSSFRHRRIGRLARTFTPSVSVIIPAFNEERVVVRTIRSILASRYPHFNIIVINDGSTDRTQFVLQQAFGDHPLVRIISQENAGKANALNRGIAETDAPIVVALDADTIFAPQTLRRLVARFVDQRVAAVAGNAKVGNRVNLLTRWQALEYITMQNLDRRAFELLNAIVVVPGSVGAWRRNVVLEAGGFLDDTLAEDADLTLRIIRNGWQVAYEDTAIAYTEAPETVRNFVRQRFRWMYGTLQAVWKQRGTLFHPRHGSLGFVALPNVVIFQVLFPFVSPLIDIALIFSVSWALWQGWSHTDISAFQDAKTLGWFYLGFLIVDFCSAAVPFAFERREQKSLLLSLPFQRFFYRQLLYVVAIRSVVTALAGKLVGWNKFNRTARLSLESQSLSIKNTK